MYELPLFPLNTVLFPGIPIQLHIFEPRYRLMVRDCLEKSAVFGVVLIRHGMEALGPLPDPYPIGCTARIIEIEPLGNGRINLTAIGQERFEILHLSHEHPYLVGTIREYPLQRSHSIDISRSCHGIRKQVDHYLHLVSKIGEDRFAGLELPDDTLAFMYMAASLLQIPAIEKQPMLACPTASELLSLLKRVYAREIALLERLSPVKKELAERVSWLN